MFRDRTLERIKERKEFRIINKMPYEVHLKVTVKRQLCTR